jgi:hypothetical protein
MSDVRIEWQGRDIDHGALLALQAAYPASGALSLTARGHWWLRNVLSQESDHDEPLYVRSQVGCPFSSADKMHGRAGSMQTAQYKSDELSRLLIAQQTRSSLSSSSSWNCHLNQTPKTHH